MHDILQNQMFVNVIWSYCHFLMSTVESLRMPRKILTCPNAFEHIQFKVSFPKKNAMSLPRKTRYLVVDLTHGTGAKLTTLLWARRKTESHIIAKSHSTKSKSPWARLIHHIQWHHRILTKQCGHAEFNCITSHSKISKNIKNMRKPCGHAGCHEIW